VLALWFEREAVACGLVVGWFNSVDKRGGNRLQLSALRLSNFDELRRVESRPFIDLTQFPLKSISLYILKLN